MYSGTFVPAPGTATTPGITRLAAEVALQLEHVIGEPIRRVGVAPHRPHRVLVAARRPAEPEVDAPRVQRRERAELLGDRERRVVRQHHATGTEPDRARCAPRCGRSARSSPTTRSTPCCGARRTRPARSREPRLAGRAPRCSRTHRRPCLPRADDRQVEDRQRHLHTTSMPVGICRRTSSTPER